jgi:hypothetical protein
MITAVGDGKSVAIREQFRQLEEGSIITVTGNRGARDPREGMVSAAP